ncbi:site-specific integrase [Brevibacillus laterosporus]|uniref:Site-specific integrase n=1 Tax=Brevibacillus laterosporus TaxID=1465 RepID=A0A518V351_BRELA|nr:site-specific integrase [Brevibacillus laterosporus]
MASFQKYTTKDGAKWLYKTYTTTDPITGKKKQTTKRGFKTKKEAQLDAIQFEQDIANGLYSPSSKVVTFEDVYQQWFEIHSKTIKRSTQKSIKSLFKNQIIPHFGKLHLKDISKHYCQTFINQIATKFKAVSIVKMYVGQVFTFALKMDLIKMNPIEHVVIPKKASNFVYEDDTEDRSYWEKNEIKQFISITKEELKFRDVLLFHMLIYTGARKGEILALQWQDIDFDKKTVSFSKTLFYDKEGFIFQTPKTARSKRVISIDSKTLDLLRKWRTEVKKRQLALTTPIHTNDMIFTRVDGVPLRLAYPNDKLKEIIKKHNLHPITIHGLRHTHASLLFEANASIKEVQERLGHTDIKMTMNIYTHVTKSVKEQTANKFLHFLEG